MKSYLPYRPYQPYQAGAAGGLSARATVLGTQSIRVSFSQCVDITAATGIQVKVGAAAWEVVASVSWGSAKVWEFSTTTVIAEGDVVLWQYLGAEDSIVDCDESVDVGVLGPFTVINQLELTAPTLVSAEIGTVLDGTDDVLVLTFDEAVTATDFADGWTVEEGANTLTITEAAHPSTAIIHLTIDERIEIGQTITVSYNDAVGSIVDVSGFPTPNALASVTDAAVTNDVALVSLVITPDAPTIDAGDTQQFAATGTYNNGGTLDITAAVTWDSSNDSFATIAADGLATGVAEGTVTISAALGAISDTTSLAVEESAATLVSIAITPDAGTIDYGATQQFTATGTYSDASTADITGDVTWDSSDDDVATITTGGLATGVAGGQATISAELGAVSGSTTTAVPIFFRNFADLTLGANATYTRSNVASHKQTNGSWAKCLANEARFRNALRYNNFVRELSGSLVASSDNLSAGAKTGCTTEFTGGVTVATVTGATAYFRPCVSNTGVSHTSLVAGRTIIQTVEVRGVGTAIGQKIALVSTRVGDTGGSQVSAPLTADWIRLSQKRALTVSTVSYLALSLRNFEGSDVPVGGVVEFRRYSIVDVTGLTNQNPPMHVSAGLSDITAGVDGVKYFPHQNGNTVDANGTVTEAQGAALTGPFELLRERVALNYLAYSDVPVTRTTGSLTAGTYTLWVEGTGSALVSAGTATISGASAATEGVPNVFTVVGPGTVTVTVTGTLSVFQLEQYDVPTSFIYTGSTGGNRQIDGLAYSGIAADNESRILTNDYNLDVDDWSGTTPTPTEPFYHDSTIAAYLSGTRPAATQYSPVVFSNTGTEIDRTDYIQTSPFGSVDIDTDAGLLTVSGFTNIKTEYPPWASLGVYVNGVYSQTILATAEGAFSELIAVPLGDKTVSIVNGLQSSPTESFNAVLGTFVTGISGMVNVANAAVPTANRLVIYGDSIAVGANAATPEKDGWPALLRAALYPSAAVEVEAFGYRSLHMDAVDGTARAAFVAKIVAYAPARLWMAVGTNDYGLNKWSAASFGTAYAALLDALHTALPSLVIYCQTPLSRTTETANGSGSMLGDYRTQIATAVSTRTAYATLVDGTTIMTTASLADGVHPTTAGHALYAAFVEAAL